MAINIRENIFNEGDIVYWCHNFGNGRYKVNWGRVDKQFSNAVIIDYLERKEYRKINGIPINEFQSETKYKKLPKGWTYNTILFNYDFGVEEDLEEIIKINITKPETIKEAYKKGYLVKSEEIFHGTVEAEITKEGYRIVKKYPRLLYKPTNTSINPWKVYFTYDEAKKEVDENIAEFTRQANLSDYEWSVEQIDKTLNKYRNFTGVNEDQIQEVREFLLGLDKVEDIETRIFCGNVQWKYWNNKKWMNLDV